MNSKGRMRFVASPKLSSKDKWSKYRLTPGELAPKILKRLSELTVIESRPARPAPTLDGASDTADEASLLTSAKARSTGAQP